MANVMYLSFPNRPAIQKLRIWSPITSPLLLTNTYTQRPTLTHMVFPAFGHISLVSGALLILAA
ncbi:hypothetical protein M434DRAFT_398157 [Hypoxylon sp. CO27-5]|nr:hypothetical protein M434DRAFT_398157 [Hypoxylon sp. CO27-5]